MSDQLSLEQWLARIEAGYPTEIDMGLERVAKVAQAMGLSLGRAKVVTVAGTNGKGSTTIMLDAILRASGARTGVYTSPHFLHYNERIQVLGKAASDTAICEAFSFIDQSRNGISLTYFEFGTLAALYLFSRAELDYVVLEVGLGGRLDAVNIIDADAAILTSVALDHTDWLGDTLEQIGYEKAGIFRAAKPAICGLAQPPSTVIEHADSIGADLYRRGVDFDLTYEGDLWSWHGLDAQGVALSYEYLPRPNLPLVNAPNVLQALALVAPQVGIDSIKAGLESAQMMGRMQREYLGQTPMILDVAHNPEAASYLALRIQDMQVGGKVRLVLGMLSDKDRASVINTLGAVVDDWHLVSLKGPRASSAAQLQAFLSSSAQQYEDVGAALFALADIVSKDDLVLVCGSFLTVTEALQWLMQHR